MPTAFVTGATGFVGLNLVELLQRSGWRVVAAHRATSDLSLLRPLGPQLVEADSRDAGAITAAMPRGVHAVFHVAANTSLWRRRDAEQYRDNVEGTRNVVGAALARDAGRLIHTSSLAAYGLHDGAVVDEHTESTAADSPIGYLRSKWLAEQEVRAGIDRGLDAVIVAPSNVLGRYDPGNWSRIVGWLRDGRLPVVPPGATTFCHAPGVAQAHVAAYERGRRGESYLLGGTHASILEMVQAVAACLGVAAPRKTVSARALAVYARLADWAAVVTGREPRITPEMATLFSATTRCDCSKAVRELGFRPVAMSVMVEETVRWVLHGDEARKREAA